MLSQEVQLRQQRYEDERNQRALKEFLAPQPLLRAQLFGEPQPQQQFLPQRNNNSIELIDITGEVNNPEIELIDLSEEENHDNYVSIIDRFPGLYQNHNQYL